jgi:hypothetical protein
MLRYIDFKLKSTNHTLLHKHFCKSWNLDMSPLNTFFFFFAVLGFELRAYTLSHSISPFLWWIFFKIRISRTICPDWLQTVILLISAFWVAKIINVSHWLLAEDRSFADGHNISLLCIKFKKFNKFRFISYWHEQKEKVNYMKAEKQQGSRLM